MGTRADFYIGRGKDAIWKGSVAWDGYPNGISQEILKATTEAEFNSALIAYFADDRDDVSTPDMGWPWPWENSQTTDFSYAFDNGKVWASCFGHAWFDPLKEEGDNSEISDPKVEFPHMGKEHSAKAGSSRSGIMVITGRK